jgi:hypothetical protein
MTLQDAVEAFAGIENAQDAKYIVENNMVELVVPTTEDNEYPTLIQLLSSLNIQPSNEYTFRDGGYKYSVAVVEWDKLNEHLKF